MIKRLSRPLTQPETRRIKAELARIAQAASLKSLCKEFVQVVAAAAVAGIGFSLFAKQPLPFALVGCLAIGGVILGISWFEKWRKTKPRTIALKAALRAPLANVVRVTATAYAAFSEYEDLGALYAFQVGATELFILNGQEYYETGAFPCLEFELVDAPGAFYAIRPRSAKVAPAVIYTESEMLAVARIEDQRVLVGEVGHALSALQHAVA